MMSRSVVPFLAFVCLLSAGCKTTEENYRRSYEAAVEKQAAERAESDSVEATIYNKIMEKSKPQPVEVGGRQVLVLTDNAWQAYNREKVAMRKYGVVVGAMKQLFNAKAFCTRLEGLGCDAYVLADRKTNYYVVAAGFDTLEGAAAYLAEIDTRLPIKLPINPPFVYNTTRL